MKISIESANKKFLSKKMFGLFFEDINYAADGGIYAEMIENRQFAFRKSTCGIAEKTYDSIYAGNYGWENVDKDAANMSFIYGDALSENNPHFMRFNVNKEEASFTNKAYDGISMKKGESYKLLMWVRGSEDNTATVSINKDFKCIGKAEIDISGNGQYTMLTASIVANEDVSGAEFRVTQKTGSVDYGYISLMPENATCGVFRNDLFDLLKDMEPGFLRFPGGCIVEGATLDNRYRWKNTVGNTWDRKWNFSRWAVHDVTMGQGEPLYFPFYNQSFGIGFYEYFLLAEKIGAKPLPVLSVGLACQFQSDELVPVDSDEFNEYLQDALDLVEFANGDVNTEWGKIRASMGHPEPFNLEYIAIGNEQWETDRVDFFERYRRFEKAIHEVHPEIGLLGSAGPDVTTDKYTRAWDFYKEEVKSNKSFTAAVDEHYYMPPNWFYENVHMYDNFSRDIPVFAGEYAAHCDKKQNNWEAGIAEAAFMCGLERNGDVIKFASAAPLFARKGYEQWFPDFIWFDADTSMGSPSYYVQKAFSKYTGTESMEYKISVGTDVYSSVSADDENIYIKVVNAKAEAEVIDEISMACGQIELKNTKVLQMSSESKSTVNELHGERPLVLKEIAADSALNIPGYSLSVIIIKK